MKVKTTIALVLQALWELLRYDVMLKAGGFQGVHRSLGRFRPARRHSSCAPEAAIAAAMKDALCLYWKRALCLQRSVAAARLFRRYGFAAELVIGYRPEPFMTHAWVEIDGRVINDTPVYQQHFHTLERV